MFQIHFKSASKVILQIFSKKQENRILLNDQWFTAKTFRHRHTNTMRIRFKNIHICNLPPTFCLVICASVRYQSDIWIFKKVSWHLD